MNSNSHLLTGPGVRNHWSSPGSSYQPASSTHGQAPTGQHPQTMQPGSHVQYLEQQNRPQQQGPRASDQHLTEPHTLPYMHRPSQMQTVPRPESESSIEARQRIQIPAQYHPRPEQQQRPPMNVLPGNQSAPRVVSTGSLPAGCDQHSRSFSEPIIANDMPPQVPGLNFQYDQTAPYRFQQPHLQPFVSHLPLSQSTSHAFPSQGPPAHPAQQAMDRGLAFAPQTRLPQATTRQNPVDLTQMAPPSTIRPPASFSPSLQARPPCTGYCPPDCSAAHGLSRVSQTSLSPSVLTPQPGEPGPPAPSAARSDPPQQSPGRKPLNGHPWGGYAQHAPPPQQQPPHQGVAQQIQQTRPPPTVAISNATDAQVPAQSPTVVLGAPAGTPDESAQMAMLNEAMVAALTPIRGGVEHLWGQMVHHIQTVLERMMTDYIGTLQAERNKFIKSEEKVKEKDCQNLKLMEEKVKLVETVTSLTKEVESVKEAMKVQGDVLLAAQRETAKLAGEKGRLEVELLALRSVGQRMAAGCDAVPSPQVLLVMLQKEVGSRLEMKLREVHQEVQGHIAARESVERKLNEMKRKLQALVGFDQGDLSATDKLIPVLPSRETSTVIGTPPPETASHSNLSSENMIASSPAPVPLSSLPPSSAPWSPVILQAAPPIDRRASPRPHLPTPPVSAAMIKTTRVAHEPSNDTTSSSSIPVRPTVDRSVSTPAPPVAVVDGNGFSAGVKRPRPASGQDAEEPGPVRRLSEVSEGPRREGLNSRSGSRAPHASVPIPPITSISTDATTNDGESAMEVDRPPPSSVKAPVPATGMPTLSVSSPAAAVDGAATTNLPKEDTHMRDVGKDKERGKTEEKVVVKLEDEVDQLMDELAEHDEVEEGEALDQPESPPAPPTASAPEPSLPSSSRPSQPLAQGANSTVPSSPRPAAAPSLLTSPSQPPPVHQISASSPNSPSSRSWVAGQQPQSGSSSYVPPARSWAQAYPSRSGVKPMTQSSQAGPSSSVPPGPPPSIKEEQVFRPPPGPPKLSVMKHWDLLYIDDGANWKCRLCQTNPNPGIPRAVFDKKTQHNVMLEHSQKEHPVACGDMAKLSNDKLAEMKARLPPQCRT